MVCVAPTYGRICVGVVERVVLGRAQNKNINKTYLRIVGSILIIYLKISFSNIKNITGPITHP